MIEPLRVTLGALLGVLAIACDEKNGGDGEEGPGATCWEQTTRSECELLGDACGFLDGTYEGTYVDGMCMHEALVDVGWCVPTEDFGGNQIGSVWHHTSSGRVMALGLSPNSHPAEWEVCPFADGPSFEFCPTPVEACQVCICEGVEASTSATGSGT